MSNKLPPANSTQDLKGRLQTLVNSAEVLRLINDITTCEVDWDDHLSLSPDLQTSRGLELFPCFTMHFQERYLQVKGAIFPNIPEGGEGLSHVITMELAGQAIAFRLTTNQTYVLSPFHLRFLSMLFGRLVLHHLVFPLDDKRGHLQFTPYSLEEQVVAGYLQSLRWAPCATIKLDAQDNPYIGSMLHSEKALRRCEMPGSHQEEALIRAWRLFKRLLYYSIEGGRLFTGFAFIPSFVPQETIQRRWPSLLPYREDSRLSLDEDLQALKQFLLHADGRTTFLAIQDGRLFGLVHLTKGTHRQLASSRAWDAALPLTSVSSRGRVSFWVPLRGRQTPQIPLVVLEYRYGQLRIPLFQDIFWLELENQLKEVCPLCDRPDYLSRLKRLLAMIKRSGHGAIFILGLTPEQMASPDTPVENQVYLEKTAPLTDRWLPHLHGMAKSDGALLFNIQLEGVAFGARLKAAPVHLPPERDDLGSGMRHQVTREFTTLAPNLLGLTISQDGYLSLYRHGKLISRLY
ncbi:MAG: hypothetical protein WAU47_04650 [Desulfobaccales bacterium]